MGIILWWVVDTIRTDPNWWLFSTESLAMTLSQVSQAAASHCPYHYLVSQWAGALLFLIGLNWWLHPLSISPPSHPLTKRSVALSLVSAAITLFFRLVGLFITYDWRDSPSSESTPTSSTTEKEPPVDLQSVRETPPTSDTATPPVLVDDVEL